MSSVLYDTVAVSDTLIIDVLVTGLSANNNLNTVKVYPNPTNSIIYIDNGDISKMVGYSINILNVQAQTVYSSQVNQQTMSVNVGQLGALGTCFLQILDPGMNVVEIRHIILQ